MDERTLALPPDPGKGRRSRLRALVRYTAPLVVAGALGAGIALGVDAAVDGGDAEPAAQRAAPASQTQAQAPSDPAASRFAAEGGGLSVQEIYRRVGPGVVQITATAQGARSPFDPFGPAQEQEALGSGFVIDKNGHIVTNFHVVQGADQVDVSFSNGDRVRAQVVGADASTDIAVLKVELRSDALTPLPLGDSSGVEVGDPVVAIGNPFGLERTVTAGIVSAIQREIRSPNGYEIDHVIQTDAQINRGNSGGPLLDANGEVIGVNSQIATGGAAGNVGIGFAVPIATVQRVVSQLIETGSVERAYLGIEMHTISEEAAQTFRLPTDEGVLVATVRPGSPADRAGLEGGDRSVVVDGQSWTLGGDVITKVDGNAIEGADEIQDAVLAKSPGDTATLEINRDGETMTITVELGRQPTTPTG